MTGPELHFLEQRDHAHHVSTVLHPDWRGSMCTGDTAFAAALTRAVLEDVEVPW